MPRMIGRGLSRREREVLEVLHRRGSATAAEVMETLADPPSYSAVRSVLRILENKSHVTHREDGKRYLYEPVVSREKAATSALEHVIRTFFGNSLESAVRSFLSGRDADLSDEELERLSALVEDARKSKEER